MAGRLAGYGLAGWPVLTGWPAGRLKGLHFQHAWDEDHCIFSLDHIEENDLEHGGYLETHLEDGMECKEDNITSNLEEDMKDEGYWKLLSCRSNLQGGAFSLEDLKRSIKHPNQVLSAFG